MHNGHPAVDKDSLTFPCDEGFLHESHVLDAILCVVFASRVELEAPQGPRLLAMAIWYHKYVIALDVDPGTASALISIALNSIALTVTQYYAKYPGQHH